MPLATPTSPDRLAVRFWGVRGSTPTPDAGNLGVGGNTSCVQLRAADGTTCILDAGTGARGLGYALAAEAAGRPVEAHVLFSHFHWDHIQGLPFFAPLYAPGNTVSFYSALDADRVDNLLRGQMCWPYFPVPFSALGATTRTVSVVEGEPFAIGSLQVQAFAVNHPQGAYGFRIEADGTSLVYASDFEHGDPEADARLLEMARGADVLICDAQYTPEEYELRRGWGHTTWLHAAELAATAGVERLFLFHHDPSHDDEALARILERARTVFAGSELATERGSFTL